MYKFTVFQQSHLSLGVFNIASECSVCACLKIAVASHAAE